MTIGKHDFAFGTTKDNKVVFEIAYGYQTLVTVDMEPDVALRVAAALTETAEKAIDARKKS